jgi:hypothetical protein
MMEYADSNNILEPLPLVSQASTCSLLPDWIKGGANATLFLFEMSKPRHGTLQTNEHGDWIFCKGTLLPDLSANCQQLMDTGQRFRGHAKFRKVYNARAQIQLRDCVLRHVSAHGLVSLIPPTSLKHHDKLESSDKIIWDSAYNEEFDGLVSLPSWEIITETQFKQLSKGIKALPTMAIA